jgi:hypothetical protein
MKLPKPEREPALCAAGTTAGVEEEDDDEVEGEVVDVLILDSEKSYCFSYHLPSFSTKFVTALSYFPASK